MGVQGVSCCLWGSVVHADAICGTLGSSRPICISCWMEGSGQIRGSRDCISQVALSCGRTLTLVWCMLPGPAAVNAWSGAYTHADGPFAQTNSRPPRSRRSVQRCGCPGLLRSTWDRELPTARCPAALILITQGFKEEPRWKWWVAALALRFPFTMTKAQNQSRSSELKIGYSGGLDTFCCDVCVC